MLSSTNFAGAVALARFHLFFLFSLSFAFPTSTPKNQVVLQEVISPPPEFQGWFDPRINGGRFLDYTNPIFGEPLNIIITSRSDPFILTDIGLRTYAESVGYSNECLDIHLGTLHTADLGDGDGQKFQQFLARQNFPVMGTCWESLAGGHHFRAWKQNGTLANSGAWFLGASKEQPASQNHMIVPDGYNIGRNYFVERAVAGTQFHGKWWKAEVEWREGLLAPGRRGVNHAIRQDGLVAILTVHKL